MTERLTSFRRLLLFSAALLLCWILLATILRDNLGSSVRPFNDYFDRMDYFRRGAWLRMNAVPYRDVVIEYPQVATFLFGILYIPFLGHRDLDSIFFNYTI